METSGSARVALGDARQRTIDALCRHFANDALELAEFEQRVERAYRAASLAELQELLVGLPGEATPEARGRVSVAPRSAARRSRDVLLAILSGVNRRGQWSPPRELVVAAVMGGADLDLREARLLPGVTEVTVYAFMGGVRIVVPPELRVEIGGFAFMGGVDPGPEAREAASTADGPTLRVRTYVVMGGVSIERSGAGAAEQGGTPASGQARLEGR
ncbi:MAG TPA: DUF1707 domain-containing protein [Longimicrobiales bacterium]